MVISEYCPSGAVRPYGNTGWYERPGQPSFFSLQGGPDREPRAGDKLDLS